MMTMKTPNMITKTRTTAVKNTQKFSSLLQFDRFVLKQNGSFAFYDTMGLQARDGVHTDDIISALKGHMKTGYMVR